MTEMYRSWDILMPICLNNTQPISPGKHYLSVLRLSPCSEYLKRDCCLDDSNQVANGKRYNASRRTGAMLLPSDTIVFAERNAFNGRQVWRKKALVERLQAAVLFVLLVVVTGGIIWQEEKRMLFRERFGNFNRVRSEENLQEPDFPHFIPFVVLGWGLISSHGPEDGRITVGAR